jgi:hypothetical protein
MAFVSAFPGSSLRAVAPTATGYAVSMSSHTYSAQTRRAFLTAGVAAAATFLASGARAPARADQTMMTKRRSYDRYFPRIEAGVPLVAAIGAAIKAGDLSFAKSLASDKVVDVQLRRSFNIFATSFSDSSVTVQTQQLLAAAAGFFDNLALAVDAKTQDDAIAKFNVAVDAYKAYIRVARLSKLYDIALSI